MTTKKLLRGRVKELLNLGVIDPDTDEGQPSNARINSAIEEARNMLYSRLSSEMPRRFGTVTSMTYAASSEYVAVSAAALGRPVFKVEVVQTGGSVPWTLDPAVVEEFRNLSQYGTPLVYALVGGNIYLRPVPTFAATVKLYHSGGLTVLGDSDSPTEINSLFHHVIAYGAAIRLSASMGDPTENLERMYENDLRTMLSHYETLGRDNHVHEVEHAETRYG